MSINSIWFATLSQAERRELEIVTRDTMLKTPDVLVVGGGIIGLATAYFLAERGASVQLIEAGAIATGAVAAASITREESGPTTRDLRTPPDFSRWLF